MSKTQHSIYCTYVRYGLKRTITNNLHSFRLGFMRSKINIWMKYFFSWIYKFIWRFLNHFMEIKLKIISNQKLKHYLNRFMPSVRLKNCVFTLIKYWPEELVNYQLNIIYHLNLSDLSASQTWWGISPASKQWRIQIDVDPRGLLGLKYVNSYTRSSRDPINSFSLP